MTNTINSQFYVQQFFQYAGWPKYNKYSNVYNACCPLCREGKSWGKKKRLYYMVDKDVVCCHNCGWYGSVLKWCLEASGKTYDELIADAGVIDLTASIMRNLPIERKESLPLPDDSINIFSKEQLAYYSKESSWATLSQIVSFVVKRRLHIAINKPRALYVSLTDKIHMNRLCIPFLDDGKVIHYQTRGVLAADLAERPKYLSRVNSERSIFNIDNIDSDHNRVYITEGPLDACFIKNGIGIAGIQERSGTQSFSERQSNQLAGFPLHKQVWCLDSQYLDDTSYKKSKQLIDLGKSIFIWPSAEGKKYKDFNEMCISQECNEVTTEWVDSNTYSGNTARLRLSQVRIS